MERAARGKMLMIADPWRSFCSYVKHRLVRRPVLGSLKTVRCDDVVGRRVTTTLRRRRRRCHGRQLSTHGAAPYPSLSPTSCSQTVSCYRCQAWSALLLWGVQSISWGMSGCLFPLSSSFVCCCSSISSSLSATMCLAGWFLSYCLCSLGVAAFITTSQAVARARLLLLLPSSPLPLLLTHRVNPPPPSSSTRTEVRASWRNPNNSSAILCMRPPKSHPNWNTSINRPRLRARPPPTHKQLGFPNQQGSNNCQSYLDHALIGRRAAH